MIPPILVGFGFGALALGLLVLRSFGPGYRIGRLLSATRTVGIDEALRIAAAGERRYVAVAGRIDSEAEFEDEHHRPLVFRRTRLEARRGGRWQTLDERREAVNFEIGEALGAIGIDHAALDEGLVVIPRESVGVAGDAAASLPVPLAPETVVRFRIEQVSSVEHAIVVGVPESGAEGTAHMTGAPGRPLILTTLERGEAMRVLAGGRRRRIAVAATTLVAGLALVAAGIAWAVVGVVTSGPSAGASGGATGPAAGATTGAASSGATETTASPGASPATDGGAAVGDTRSPGEGPGFVGAPLLAIGGVLGIGLAAAGLTAVYVRLTDDVGAGRASGEVGAGDRAAGLTDDPGRPGGR